jgi:hypothetical protein
MFRHAKKWFVRSRTIGPAFAIICGYEASNISIARMHYVARAEDSAESNLQRQYIFDPWISRPD